MRLYGKGKKLSSHQPHRPPSQENAAQEQNKTIETVADHIARGLAMRDAEDNGSKKREDESGAKVSELDGHNFMVNVFSRWRYGRRRRPQ
jgi:hypothetical protein